MGDAILSLKHRTKCKINTDEQKRDYKKALKKHCTRRNSWWKITCLPLSVSQLMDKERLWSGALSGGYQEETSLFVGPPTPLLSAVLCHWMSNFLMACQHITIKSAT